MAERIRVSGRWVPEFILHRLLQSADGQRDWILSHQRRSAAWFIGTNLWFWGRAGIHYGDIRVCTHCGCWMHFRLCVLDLEPIQESARQTPLISVQPNCFSSFISSQSFSQLENKLHFVLNWNMVAQWKRPVSSFDNNGHKSNQQSTSSTPKSTTSSMKVGYLSKFSHVVIVVYLEKRMEHEFERCLIMKYINLNRKN